MKKKIFTSLCCLLILTLGGCKKFLDVNPKSTVSEDALFTSEIGFQQALIGVYSGEAERELYGDNLSMGFLSALAQNYNPSAHDFIFKETTALNYNTSEVKDRLSEIWTKSYNAIAGINNIAEKADQRKGIFTGNNYALIKGEALGLRAYLHFDLLRLFGPAYSENATKVTIPYRTEFNPFSKKPETAAEVVSHIMTDLKEAEALLKATDPIMGENKNRRFKMNYFAVMALQARVYLYKGDKANAMLAANAVINSGKFKFVDGKDISAAAKDKDRLFSNEQILALRVRTIKDWTESDFPYFRDGGTWSKNNLSRTEANLKTLFETANGGTSDYRYAYLIESDGTALFTSKYWQTWEASAGALPEARLDQTVPLIRLSEMYYILAECAATPEEGISALNIVRRNRAIPEIPVAGITAQMLTDQITKEYQKEFYAEGQLFFYYKRKLTVRMLFSTKNLTEANYILPIPDDELEFNPNYN